MHSINKLSFALKAGEFKKKEDEVALYDLFYAVISEESESFKKKEGFAVLGYKDTSQIIQKVAHEVDLIVQRLQEKYSKPEPIVLSFQKHIQHLESEFKKHASDLAPKGLLNYAISSGLTDVALSLIAAGVDITPTDREGNTFLHLAIQRKNSKIARALIKAGASIHAPNKLRETPLHFAVLTGDLETATLLMKKGASPNALDASLATPLSLIFSSDTHDPIIAELLIDHGADIHTKDEETGFSLMHRAAFANFIGLIKLFAKHDRRLLDSEDLFGDTPLLIAPRYKQTAAAKALIELGANVNHASSDGNTALHLAVECGDLDLIHLLLSAGANPKVPNRKGKNPLQLAENKDPAIYKFITDALREKRATGGH